MKLRPLKDYAVGTLQQWFNGYTEIENRDGINTMDKIVIRRYTKDGVVFEVREGPEFLANDSLFVATVKVKRLGKKAS